MARIKVICRTCKGENVSIDATGRFDVATQQWELTDTMDAAYCDDCAEEVYLDEVPLPEQPTER